MAKRKNNSNNKSNAPELSIIGEEKAPEQKTVRQIRQVYIEDEPAKDKTEKDNDGSAKANTEPAKPVEPVKSAEPDNNQEEHVIFPKEPHAEKSHRNPVRLASVIVVLVCSLLLSMCVGGGLALWDSGKTVADLNTALFNKDVYAATEIGTTADAGISDDDLEEKNDARSEMTSEETPADGTPHESVNKEVYSEEQSPEDDEEISRTDVTSEISGLETLTKAGSDDEIVLSQTPSTQVIGGDPSANYPLTFTTVDESYFTDALFIGDSRLQGFGMWSGLPATYYCATGFSIFKYETAKVVQTEEGKVPIFDALPYDAFTKIYIKVGLNEMGWDNEKQFEAKYVELIEKLREYEPRAIIYIHGILPVTAAKSASDKAHNNPNIIARNERLQELAKEQHAYYIDAGPALSDENGDLRPEMTSDGIHLASQYMKLWKQFLCEHAIVVR